MTFTPKNWVDGSGGGTPISAAALEDVETRLSDYTDDLSQAELNRAGWVPTGAITETLIRSELTAATGGVTSGTLRLIGGITLPAGQAVTSISFMSIGAAGTPTNQWFCLVRQSDRSVLAKTVDDTTTAWGAATAKTLTIAGGPYTPSVNTPAYVGIVQVAATPASLVAQSAATNAVLIPPVLVGNSTTGLTDPASLGATAAALSGGNGNLIWAWCS